MPKPNPGPAAATGLPADPLREAMSLLEGEAHDLRCMASIACTLTEKALERPEGDWPKPGLYYVTEEEVNEVLFACINTAIRARELYNHVIGALEGSGTIAEAVHG